MRNCYLLATCLLLSYITRAQNAIDYSYQLTATTQVSPPQIKVNWKKIAGVNSYEVYKKTKGATSFGSPIATLTATDSFYVDNSVTVDSTYEYQVFGGPNASGYIYASVKAAPVHYRGGILLLVDSTFSDSCRNEIERLKRDLRGDGWKVLSKSFLRTETAANIKSYITSTYNSDNTLRSIFILGHIAVPYSGNLNPDAHPDHQGAWPADVFYADMNGTWSDNTVNNTVASRTQNDNIPGDGKYDQSTLPSDVELQIGRVDFANMPAFAKTEIALMRSYLNRDHLYKMDSLSVIHRGLVDDNFGLSTGEPFAANAWRNFSPLIDYGNTQSLDYITTLNTANYQWSYGCGGGSYTSASGIGNTANIASNNINSIFTMLFGSYFGDWDANDNFLRAPLCANTPALTNCWAGRPHWFFHHMALGEPIGYSALISQNNDGSLYQAKNNYGTRMIHIALMGDPSLRTDYIKPLSNITVTDLPPKGARINWTASSDPGVIGYYVYRSDDLYGQYKLRSGLVNITSYIDSYGTAGTKYYMVRAAKVQNTPSGSYQNLSLGTVATATIITTYAHNDTFLTYIPVAAKSGNNIVLYPNPAYEVLFAKINLNTEANAKYIITDIIGRIWSSEEKKLNAGENTIRIDASSFPKGIYTFSLLTDNNRQVILWSKD